jgi:hypothetical protein
MTDSLTSVVIPYSRFEEYRNRRRRLAAELMVLERPRTIDAEVVSGPREPALSQSVNDTQS